MTVGTIRRPRFAAKLAAQRYSDLCTIQRQNLVDDNRGGQTPSNPSDPWPTVIDEDAAPIVFPCYVSPKVNPTEGIRDGRITFEGGFDVAIDSAVDIRNSDRIKVSTLDNRIFHIIGPRFAGDEVSQILAAEEVI